MKFTIKRKKNGRNWKVFDELHALNWEDAKAEFSELMKEDLASNGGVYLANEQECIAQYGELVSDSVWMGAGWYGDAGETILDGKKYDTYCDGWATYTIKSV